MAIDFTNITEDVIPMNQFRLNNRFTNERYVTFPNLHLQQLKPLGKRGSRFLWDYTIKSNLHGNAPFKKDFFRKIDKAPIKEGNEKETKMWLQKCGLPFDKPVYLSWQPNEAMIVPWKIFINYFDHFYSCNVCDLTVIDQSLNWALLVHHQEKIYFGSNTESETGERQQHLSFSW
jgi:hypothetical protein